MTLSQSFAGIDVAKDKIDIAIMAANGRTETFTSMTDTPTLKEAVTRLKKRKVGLVVLEATGGYELPVMAALAAAGVVFSRVNPRQVRDFAKAAGILAKTDTLDAKVLAQFGQKMAPAPTSMPTQKMIDLHELSLRREQLVEMRQREKNRLHRMREATGRASLIRVIEMLDDEIATINKALDEAVEEVPELAQRRDLIDSCPGLATVSATKVAIDLPELGMLSTKKLKKLVGVAPINDDSAGRRGEQHISGGRASLRQTLYMAAQTGYRHNPALKALYDRLRAKGRCHKVAIVACIGKLLSILNAIVRTAKPYDATRASV